MPLEVVRTRRWLRPLRLLVIVHPVIVLLECFPQFCAGPRLTKTGVVVRPGNKRRTDLAPVVPIHLPNFKIRVLNVQLNLSALLIGVFRKANHVNARVGAAALRIGVRLIVVQEQICGVNIFCLLCGIQIHDRSLVGVTALP